MNESALRELICTLGQRLYALEMVMATDGNLSVRLGPDRFLCTPSGVSKAEMLPDDLIIADSNGERVSGDKKVTSEFFTHLAAYEERPDVDAVIHAHPTYGIALTLAGISLETPVLPETVALFGGIPTAPYSTPSSKEGAEAIRPLIRRCDGLLLDRHGALTVGKSLTEAFMKMEKLEHAAKILYLAYSLGKVAPLNDIQLAKVIQARTEYGVSSPMFGFDK